MTDRASHDDVWRRWWCPNWAWGLMTWRRTGRPGDKMTDDPDLTDQYGPGPGRPDDWTRSVGPRRRRPGVLTTTKSRRLEVNQINQSPNTIAAIKSPAIILQIQSTTKQRRRDDDDLPAWSTWPDFATIANLQLIQNLANCNRCKIIRNSNNKYNCFAKFSNQQPPNTVGWWWSVDAEYVAGLVSCLSCQLVRWMTTAMVEIWLE